MSGIQHCCAAYNASAQHEMLCMFVMTGQGMPLQLLIPEGPQVQGPNAFLLELFSLSSEWDSCNCRVPNNPACHTLRRDLSLTVQNWHMVSGAYCPNEIGENSCDAD